MEATTRLLLPVDTIIAEMSIRLAPTLRNNRTSTSVALADMLSS